MRLFSIRQPSFLVFYTKILIMFNPPVHANRSVGNDQHQQENQRIFDEDVVERKSIP